MKKFIHPGNGKIFFPKKITGNYIPLKETKELTLSNAFHAVIGANNILYAKNNTKRSEPIYVFLNEFKKSCPELEVTLTVKKEYENLVIDKQWARHVRWKNEDDYIVIFKTSFDFFEEFENNSNFTWEI